MTGLGEERVGVFLAAAVRHGARPVARELLLLPIPVLKTRWWKVSGFVAQSSGEVVSHGARKLARLVQRWEVMTATSEAGGRPSTLQLSSLSEFVLLVG